MTRPRYETAEDLRKEKLVAQLFSQNYVGSTLFKMPDSYHLDFLVKVKHEARAAMEVKCRKITFGQYDTIILSLLKWKAGLEFERLGLGFLISFALEDGIYLYRHLAEHTITEMNIQFRGRTISHRDSADTEPMVNIKTEWLTKYSEINVHKSE